MNYQYHDGGRAKYFKAKDVNDCAVRAISKVLDISWEDAFNKLAVNAFRMGDMPSSNNVIASVLRMNGFYKENLPDTCPDCYTIRKFCRDNPVGTYVLGTGSHDVLDKLTHTIKNLDKVIDGNEGYSGRYPMYDADGRSYAKRDSRGRYSRGDGYGGYVYDDMRR